MLSGHVGKGHAALEQLWGRPSHCLCVSGVWEGFFFLTKDWLLRWVGNRMGWYTWRDMGLSLSES